MASIGLLAAGVAHDINNPIGFVTNNLEELHEYLSKFKTCIRNQSVLIQESASTDLLQKLQENHKSFGIDQIFDDFDTLIAESLEGTKRISDIVKNLRNFSRIDDADYKLSDINECLEDAIKITQHELRNKAQVNRELGNIPSIYCCPQQLNQVFMNILVNAAHAIDKRGEITIRTWEDSHWVYITITDTGCGIPNKVLPKIFEPFFTTKEIAKAKKMPQLKTIFRNLKYILCPELLRALEIRKTVR
jgi:two-component system NtrC family sensor kinase